MTTSTADESWRRREHLHRCMVCLVYKDCGGLNHYCDKPYQLTCEFHKTQFIKHGDAARLVGVAKQTLYIWEKRGIIAPAARDRNNHRLFTLDAIAKIKAMKDAYQ